MSNQCDHLCFCRGVFLPRAFAIGIRTFNRYKGTMRIKQQSVFLSQLVREVSRGVMLPAAFQRPYVWKTDDVLALCDSVRAGFPLGGFLTWAPGRAADLSRVGRNRLGPIVPGEDSPAEKLLLDGQNRLATIAWMLQDDTMPMPSDLSAAEVHTWGSGRKLVVDLETETLCFVDKADADVGFRLPARAAFGVGDYMTLIRSRWATSWAGLSEERRNKGLVWQDKLVDSFRDARVVETLLENATVEEAKHAFLHICKVGVPMSAADFDAAMNWPLESK